MVKYIASFGVALLLMACSQTSYQSYVSDNVELDSTYHSDQLEEVIAPFRIEVDEKMSEIIGYADSALVKYTPESPLGNFTADVVFEKGMELKSPFSDLSVDNTIALINFGGLRAPINQGDISIGNVFELMPFDNAITIVKIEEQAMVDMCAYLLGVNGQPVSNARFDLKKNDYKLYVNNELFDSKKPLYIITSNYLATGGDKMSFLKNGVDKWDSGVLMRDVFIDYIRAKKRLGYYDIEGRILIDG